MVGAGSTELTGGALAVLSWAKRLWGEHLQPFSGGQAGALLLASEGPQTKGFMLFGWKRSLGPGRCPNSPPGSSLTVFFVDLHQGLVGLLRSCQTVLRLGREATRSGHTVPRLIQAAPQQPRSPAPNLRL